MSYQQLYENAINWTKEAGEKLRQSVKEKLAIEFKTSFSDLVTEKDGEIEQFFVKKINQLYPDHVILGEEGTAKKENYEFNESKVWVIDPIDGTTNFVNQKLNFAISVAYYDQGVPIVGIIYDPIRDELFHAQKGEGAYLNGEKLERVTPVKLEEALLSFSAIWTIPNEKVDHNKLYPLVERARGIRYIGSAALEIAWIAVGRIDAYLDFRLSPWDIGAGILLLQELGGEATTLDGEKIDMTATATTLFSRPGLAEEIKNYMQ